MGQRAGKQRQQAVVSRERVLGVRVGCRAGESYHFVFMLDNVKLVFMRREPHTHSLTHSLTHSHIAAPACEQLLASLLASLRAGTGAGECHRSTVVCSQQGSQSWMKSLWKDYTVALLV